MDPRFPPSKTPIEVWRGGLAERLAFEAVIAAARVTGMWAYPAEFEGDVERMRWLDVAYWMYKSRHPVVNPERGAGLNERLVAPSDAPLVGPELLVEERLSLSACGDLMSHHLLHRSAETLFEEVDDIVFGADVSTANLECMLGDRVGLELGISDDGGPTLGYSLQDFEVATGFADRRFTVLSVANNHSLDFGEPGVDRTIAHLHESGFAFAGINATEDDATEPTIVESRGFRLAFVSHTFGLNARQPPPDRPRIVNRLALNGPVHLASFEMLEAQIARARQCSVDFIVAQLHWGMEHEMYPRSWQIPMAHHIAELGVDAVIGHHPHVIQPLELYRTRRDERRIVPIYYSLGNLLTPFCMPYVRRSRVARLELVRGRWPDGTEGTYVALADGRGVMQHEHLDAGVLRLRAVM